MRVARSVLPILALCTAIAAGAANTIGDFRTQAPPNCDPLATRATTTTCGRSYEQALCMSMQFYMAQQGGRSPVGWRGTCFTGDTTSLGGRTRNLTLGWFDAGDYVKFGLPMAYSATALAWGALRYSDGYVIGSASANALTYNLRVVAFYLLEAWDPVSKTLVAQIGDGDADHGIWTPCRLRPNSEWRPISTISPSKPGTEVAADTASAMASIALALKKYEGSASTTLQRSLATAAKQVYDFANGAKKTYTDSVPKAYGFYKSWSGFQDELAFAGTWMHELAQANLGVATSSSYLTNAEAAYAYPWNLDWDNKMLGAALRLYEFTGKSKYVSPIKDRVTAYMTTAPRTSGGLLKILEHGSLRHAANAAFVARVAYDLGISQTTATLKFAKLQLDYILGSNPTDRSFLVGFGKNPPRNPHHRSAHDSPNNDKWNPQYNRYAVTGAIVGGPFESDWSFADDRGNYVTSEVATDYNALFSGLLASFSGSSMPSASGLSATCGANAVPVPTPAPQAPAPPPSTNAFRASVQVMSSTWLQVTVTPTPAWLRFEYNGGSATCDGNGPQWCAPPNFAPPCHYTCGPPANKQLDSSSAVAIVVADGSGRQQRIVVKEGSVAMAVTLNAPMAAFEEEVFIQNVATAADIDPVRVAVTAVAPVAPPPPSMLARMFGAKSAAAADATSVNFTIAPLAMVDYTAEGVARRSQLNQSEAAFEERTTEGLYLRFGVTSTGHVNASSPLMVAFANYGIIASTVVIQNNPTYITYAAPTSGGGGGDSDGMDAKVTAAVGAGVVLLAFGGAFAGYKYAKRNKNKYRSAADGSGGGGAPQVVIVYRGGGGGHRGSSGAAAMGAELHDVPDTGASKIVYEAAAMPLHDATPAERSGEV